MTTRAGIILLMGIQADVDPATRIHCPYQPFRRRRRLRRLSHNAVFQQSQVWRVIDTQMRRGKGWQPSIYPTCL
jgi:hypothetical protein